MLHDKSKELYERAQRVIPGGVNSNVRLGSEPFPLFYNFGRGGRIWDIDGNEYIDYVLGQGPMLLGHAPRAVVEAIRRCAVGGLLFGGQTELEVRAAELLVEHVPCAEMVRFNTTGSEAVHSAIRLARAATGRKKVLRFEGHYHGWLDTIAWCPPTRGAELGPPDDPVLRASSRGQCEEDAANILVRPWNNATLAEAAFAEHGNEIAAVICDPFACAAGLIPAELSYLQTLRGLCDRHGTVLIFDEVITGFRVTIGGAQAHYGVLPDLAVFAKALGGGLAVAAVAGKAELMKRFAGDTVHAGTYNSNVLAMAGVVAALDTLTAKGGAELEKAHVQGRKLWNGIETISRDAGMPLSLRGVPSVFSTSFLPADAKPVTDFRSSLQSDAEKLNRFWRDLHYRRVHITGFGIWFLSTAHTDAEIDKTLEAVTASLKLLAAES